MAGSLAAFKRLWNPAEGRPTSLILISTGDPSGLPPKEFGQTFALSLVGSPNIPKDVQVLGESSIDRQLLRRIQFFAEPKDLPAFFAPLLTKHVWQAGDVGNVVIGYPGVHPDFFAKANEMMRAGCDAVLLRRDEDTALVLGLARHVKNERLLAHWAREVEYFPLEFREQRGLGARLGVEIVENLCDRIASFRWTPEQPGSQAALDSQGPPIAKPPCGRWPAVSEESSGIQDKVPDCCTASPFVREALRKLLPDAPLLWEDPFENALLALNVPSSKVKQDSGNLITNMVFLTWTAREDLQAAFDLSKVEGRAALIDWFLSRAALEHGIAAELIDPVRKAREIAASRAPEDIPAPTISASGGVNLIGYPCAEMGMGELLRQSAAALSAVGTDVSILDFPFAITASKRNTTYEGLIRTDNPFDVNIFHINADLIAVAREKLGPQAFRDRYNIGYWAWELAIFPDEWLSAIDLVDEIWTLSRFMRDAIAAKTSKPVIWMPLAVEFPFPDKANSGRFREKFGLPQKSFLFLFSFDFSSFPARKNFMGCIEAFRKAFPAATAEVGLVLKTIRHPHQKQEFWKLLRAVGEDPRIHVLDLVLPQTEMRQLMVSCDSFVSLHRAEGFGLGMAEAMYLGKPIIATNYSGNTDFTKTDNSCLVEYKLVPIKLNEYPFGEGQVWADPNLDQAAEYMRRLVDDREYAAQLGEAAARFIREEHNCSKIGARFKARLDQIRAGRALLNT